MSYKQVVVMRKDLGCKKEGKLVVQGAHALSQVFLNLMNEGLPLPQDIKEWQDNCNMKKICLGVDSLEELLEIYKKAKEMGLRAVLIEDIGLTEFKSPTKTCCGIGPNLSTEIDKITGKLKLYGCQSKTIVTNS